MIREQLIEIEPGSLRLILAMVAVVIATGIALYLVKPQYLDFRDRRVSFQMLQNRSMTRRSCSKLLTGSVRISGNCSYSCTARPAICRSTKWSHTWSGVCRGSPGMRV